MISLLERIEMIFWVLLWVSLGFYIVRFILRKQVISYCGDYDIFIEIAHVVLILAMLSMYGLSLGVSAKAWSPIVGILVGFFSSYAGRLHNLKDKRRLAISMVLHALMSIGMVVMFSAISFPQAFSSAGYYAFELAIYGPLLLYYVYWIVRGAHAAYRARKLYWLAVGQDVFHVVMCFAMLTMIDQQSLGNICYSS